MTTIYQFIISARISIVTRLLVISGLIVASAGNLPINAGETANFAAWEKKVKSSQTEEMSNLVTEVHRQINQYRSSLNLEPLSLHPQISQEALTHSQNMARQKVGFSHQGFTSRIEAIEKQISYRSAAENVAYNQGNRDPVSQAVAGWLKSEGHRQNIIGNYNLTGIGVAKNRQGEYYFTQIFILN